MFIKKRKGYSLLELILVLGIAMAVSFMKFEDLKNDQENSLANSVGQQIKQVGEAVNGYINIHYDKLSILASVTTATGTDPGPRTCSTANNTCTITYQTLVNEGLLPSTFNGINANKSSYNIILKRQGTSPNFIINGLVTTNNSWIEGNNIRYDLLGKAMQTAGADSGVSKTSTSLSGYSGSWSEQSSDFSNINKTGLLGFRVGYDSSMYSVYLRRDGSLPMTGDLDMGSNNINNVKNYNSSGTITAGGDVTSGGWLTSTNGFGDTMQIGGDAVGRDYEIKLNTTGYPLVIHDNVNTTTGTILKTYGGIYSYGDMGNTGSIYANNTSSSSRNSIFNGEGAIVGKNLQATSTIAVGSASTLNAYMNSGGNIYAGNDILSQHYIYTRDSTGTIVKAYLGADGNIYASGNITGSTITSSGRFTANEFVQMNGIASLNAACSPNGLQGRDSSGSSLSCVNGLWVKAGYTYSTYSVSFSSSTSGSSSTTYQTTSMGKHLFCFVTGIQTADGLTKHVYVSVSGGSWTLEQRPTNWPAGISTWAYATCAD